MNAKSTLYWSSFTTYEACPQEFLWSYGWDGIDLGYGDGKRRPVPEKRSMHHPAMGTVIQALIEKMYNEGMLEDPKNLSANLLAKVEAEWDRTVAKSYFWVDYEEAKQSREQLLETCREGIRGFLKTMVAHKLHSLTYAQAEVPLIGWINKWVGVGGKPDVVINREDTGISILDGKNTLKKMAGVDPDQLRWYAMCFKLSYKVYPDRIGFLWYRFPHGMKTNDPETGELTTETGLTWVPFTVQEVRDLAQRAIEVRDGMRFGKFKATPVAKHCQYCDYESICPERQAQRQANAEKRPSKKMEELSTGGGFVDLDL